MALFRDLQKMPQLLRHHYVADEINKDLFTEVGKILSDPSKCLIFLTSQSIKPESLNLHEKWYNFNYSVESFDASLIQTMKEPEIAQNGKNLDLPPQNNLLPSNFDILPKNGSLSR